MLIAIGIHFRLCMSDPMLQYLRISRSHLGWTNSNIAGHVFALLLIRSPTFHTEMVVNKADCFIHTSNTFFLHN